jgi:hypothetical protein
MRLVDSKIEIINQGDLEMERRNLMDKEEVKRMITNLVVDSRAYNFASMK